MRKFIPIGVIVIAGVLTSTRVAAQQTSSAVQVVTFGVTRSAQMIVSTISAVPTSRTLSSGPSTEALQSRLERIAAKITFSPKKQSAMEVRQQELSSAESQRSTVLQGSNDDHIQTDLRTFLENRQTPTFGVSPLVFTVTD